MAIYTPNMAKKVAALCKRKVRYGTRQEADAAVRRLLYVNPRSRIPEAYPCEVCGGWHWGHSSWAKP